MKMVSLVIILINQEIMIVNQQFIKMENIMLIKEGEVLLTTDTSPYKSIT